MIFRILFIIILTAILWVGLSVFLRVFKVFRFLKAASANNGQFRTSTAEQTIVDKTMVKCSKCHLYFLDKDAFVKDGQPYCCPEHAA